MKIKFLLVLLFAALLISCAKDFELETENHPVIRTLTVDTSVPNVIRFRGEIIDLGKQPIIDLGFRWSRQSGDWFTPTGGIALGEINKEGKFEATVERHYFNSNVVYYLRAYAITQDYEVRCNIVSFTR